MPVSGPPRGALRFARFAGFAALTALALAESAGPGDCAEPQIVTLRDFKFEGGAITPELRIAYEVHGNLAPARDNAIVLIAGVRGDRDAFRALIGPGKTFDTDRYFIVTADAIGGGGSSSPADGAGQDFPRYTIRDMMEAENALVVDGLKLTRLRAVVGRSMGAFIALEWAIHHPETMQSVVLMAPSPKAEVNFQLVVDAITAVTALDPEWRGGRYRHNPVEGLRRAGMVYYPWAVSAPYLERIPSKRLAAELEAMAQSFAAWDANSLIFRYAACRAHDVSAPFAGDMSAALGRVGAPVLILASASDRLLGIDGARRIRDGVRRATYAEIPTDIGHRTTSPGTEAAEAAFIDRTVRDFLAARN